MEELTYEDLKILLFLVRNRLNYESRRKSRLNNDGKDIQQEKVYELGDLKDKLERIQLAQ